MGVDDVKLTVDNADGIVQDSLNRIILTDSRLQLKGALIQVVVAFQCSHSTAAKVVFLLVNTKCSTSKTTNKIQQKLQMNCHKS